MTIEECLTICAELWEWIAEDVSRKKETWPGWRKYGRMYENCPCCEFVRPISDCSQCPMLSVWNIGEPSPDTGEAPCERDYSPYHIWQISKNTDEKRRAAKYIAKGARKLLANNKKEDTKICKSRSIHTKGTKNNTRTLLTEP